MLSDDLDVDDVKRGHRPHFADVTMKLTFNLEDKPKGHNFIFSSP